MAEEWRNCKKVMAEEWRNIKKEMAEEWRTILTSFGRFSRTLGTAFEDLKKGMVKGWRAFKKEMVEKWRNFHFWIFPTEVEAREAIILEPHVPQHSVVHLEEDAARRAKMKPNLNRMPRQHNPWTYPFPLTQAGIERYHRDKMAGEFDDGREPDVSLYR